MSDTLPTLASATLNKTAYAKGETMVITATGSDPDEETISVTVTLENKTSGAQSNPITLTAIVDELQATATGSRTWTQSGRNGSSFTLSAVA